MSERVVIPAGTQLDSEHVALDDLVFLIQRPGERYAAKWEYQDRFGATSEALSLEDALWCAKGEVCRLWDWVRDGGEDAEYAKKWLGAQLFRCIGYHKGYANEKQPASVVLEGHLLEAGDGYEWSSLFISGMDLAEALAAAFRVEQMEDSYIQLWGHDDDGNDIDPDTTICNMAEGEEQIPWHERLFYDFGRVRITVERLGGER